LAAELSPFVEIETNWEDYSMLNRLKTFLGKNTKPQFTDKQYQRHDELKKQGLESVLGEMHNLVGHAIIPFQVGGAVDMYYFPNALDGTAFVTMELIEPDGSGPQPSKIGTYELVAFTKHRIGDEENKAAFEQIERRICGIFTVLGRYSYEVQLNPFDTVEVPVSKDEPNRCLILDEYRVPGLDFIIGDRRHSLLSVIEVFRSEMEYAMKHESQIVLSKLKEKGYYPYSDLDREPVI
jgi:hypothetical protein